MEMRTLTIASLAAGGDGVARDDAGRVTFVPRTAPGDRVRARLVQATKSFARAELESIEEPSADRVDPPCPHFKRGCGGCTWQHVSRAAQLAAKQEIVANALRKIAGLTIHPIEDPAPPLGWRRRARFHVAQGQLGLYVESSHTVLPIDHCPQLEPELDAALGLVRGASPPDGELALVRGCRGEIVVGVARPWKLAASLVGKAGIVGVVVGMQHASDVCGIGVIEIEPGLWGGPYDFAQASAAGNAALIARTRAALGRGDGAKLVELYAGAGNLTRGFVTDGWRALATDGVAPPEHAASDAKGDLVEQRVGAVADVLATIEGPVDAVVLDPPRVGAADAIDGIVRLSPRVIVYVSCDPATLARDLERLVAAGYRASGAWPIDLMPQTAHIEVVVRLER
jgi:23S rRNA (uracil1939-C5)-methyltransferase